MFGYGEASGRNRGQEALEQALQNPLMDRGSLLGQASNILVNIVGGHDLTLVEVQTVMQDLAQHIGDQTQLLFGAAVDPKLQGKLGVTLISSLGARESSAVTAQSSMNMPSSSSRPVVMSAPVPNLCSTPSESPVVATMRAPSDGAIGDNAVRGRFDKSEPTNCRR